MPGRSRWTARDVLRRLTRHANRRNVEGMLRFGIGGEGRLGVSMPILRSLGKEIGKDHRLALELWRAGVPEARILASLVADPSHMTSTQADRWIRDLDSWDVCDQLCMNVLEKAPFARMKVRQWSGRSREYERRAAFALLACMAWHRKDDPDEWFVRTFPLIRAAATDERNYVKKAVSWALRTIGKRNPRLQRAALAEADRIGRLPAPSARWISSDVRRELARRSL